MTGSLLWWHWYMNRAVKYLLISRNLITFKSLNADSVGSLYFIPTMIRIILFCCQCCKFADISFKNRYTRHRVQICEYIDLTINVRALHILHKLWNMYMVLFRCALVWCGYIVTSQSIHIFAFPYPSDFVPCTWAIIWLPRFQRSNLQVYGCSNPVGVSI